MVYNVAVVEVAEAVVVLGGIAVGTSACSSPYHWSRRISEMERWFRTPYVSLQVMRQSWWHSEQDEIGHTDYFLRKGTGLKNQGRVC